MTDKEKIAYLEGWIKAAIDQASSPVPESIIAYRARMESILYELNNALTYDESGSFSVTWFA